MDCILRCTTVLLSAPFYFTFFFCFGTHDADLATVGATSSQQMRGTHMHRKASELTDPDQETANDAVCRSIKAPVCVSVSPSPIQAYLIPKHHDGEAASPHQTQ